MPFTTPISPSSARTATSSAPSLASPKTARDRNDRALVAIGGGTGLSALLRGLKHHVGTDRLRQLTGVVTVTDDGGSSRRLPQGFRVLPPAGWPSNPGASPRKISATPSPPWPTTRTC